MVLGKPALVTAIDMYARVCIREHDSIIIESRNLGLKSRKNSVPEQLKPYTIIVDELSRRTRLRGFHAVIDSDIPIGSGMGSSAATSVAFTAALAGYLGLELSLEEISQIAFRAEELVHGKPSGIDNTVSTYGGMILYKKGSFKKIGVVWPENYFLVLVNTGIERSTRIAVKKVLERFERRKNIMEYIYRAAEEIVYSAIKALKEKDLETLGELMNINHGLLVSIGVAIPETEEIVHYSLRAGALGAKITGAGMGGSVLLLVEANKLGKVLNTIKPYARTVHVVRPTGNGVEIYVE